VAHSPTGQDDWNRLYGNPRFRDYMRVHEIMEVFPEKRHAGHATKLPTPTVGPLPPFTMNAMYFRDDNPIASLLRQHRQNPDLEGNQPFDIYDWHIGVFIHHLPSFMQFFNENLRADTHLIRTVTFERTNVEFPILNEFISLLDNLVFIHFQDVDFSMHSWRHMHDQEFLFGPRNNPRFVSFDECRFMEHFARVAVTGPNKYHQNDAGQWEELRSSHVVLTANRIPIQFYVRLLGNAHLVNLYRTG
jgi:hypothetical protein